MVNDHTMVDLLTETVDGLEWAKGWSSIPPSTGGEDFAFYCEQIPGVFFRLGSGNEDERTRYPLHHPMFDLDETAMPYGVGMLSSIALEFWQETQLLRGTFQMKKTMDWHVDYITGCSIGAQRMRWDKHRYRQQFGIKWDGKRRSCQHNTYDCSSNGY